MYWNGLRRKEIKQMIERIKVAWYALTKKEYAFFSIQRHEIGNSGGRCIISDNATRLFLETIIKFTEKYIKEKGGLYGDKNN